ncbi:MAG: hypothetical protein ACLPX9_01055 [Rhodomicrobium sp.]
MARAHPIWMAMFATVLPFGAALADGQSSKDAPTNSPWSAGLMVSTLGPGVQVSYLAYNWAVIRVEGSYVSVPTEGLTLSLQSAGAMLDLHPFENAFRVSGGIRYFEYDISGITTVNETSGPNRFRIEATNSNQAAPYLGFGLDTSHFSGGKYEFKLGLDLGVIYSGKPDVSANNLTNPGEDVQSQINNVIGKYQVLDLYPVATISARINF